MKKLIIASQICLIPLILLGTVMPVLTIVKDKGVGINMTIFWLYTIILVSSIAVIMTTIMFMSKYTGVIDRIDEEQKLLEDKRNELSVLISKYNKLLLHKENPDS